MQNTIKNTDRKKVMNKAIRGSDLPYMLEEEYKKNRDMAISIFGINITDYHMTATALYGKDATILV